MSRKRNFATSPMYLSNKKVKQAKLPQDYVNLLDLLLKYVSDLHWKLYQI